MHTASLHDGPLVRIFDVRCRPEHPDCSGEECVSRHHIVFPRAGVFVKHVRGRKVTVDPSLVLFFTAGEPYRVSHPVAGGDDCTVFAYRDEVLIEALAAVDPRVQDRPEAPFARNHGRAEASAVLPERALRHRLVRGEAGPVAADAVAATPPMPGRPRAASLRLRRDWVEATKLRLAARPEADLTLAALAREVGCSPFHLARLFRADQGLPIHQYQLRLRLALALERLLDGSSNLLSLALDLGFASHSHFSAAFRRTFGLTPSAYRRIATRRRLGEMRKILTV